MNDRRPIDIDDLDGMLDDEVMEVIDDLRAEVAHLKREITCMELQRWEPQAGIWSVSHHAYGRSTTFVGGPDVPEREAIVRAVLQMDGDVVMQAISQAYDRDRFCPTMLEHEDHGGMCGVWPSAWEMWTKIRDALAASLEEKNHE